MTDRRLNLPHLIMSEPLSIKARCLISFPTRLHQTFHASCHLIHTFLYSALGTLSLARRQADFKFFYTSAFSCCHSPHSISLSLLGLIAFRSPSCRTSASRLPCFGWPNCVPGLYCIYVSIYTRSVPPAALSGADYRIIYFKFAPIWV